MIAEITAALHDIAGDVALQKSVTYVACCLIGQAFYAVWLWTSKEIPCVWDRFRQDPQSTAHSLLANMVTIVTLVAVLPLSESPWRMIVTTALLQGISADSAFNRHAKQIWGGEERRG